MSTVGSNTCAFRVASCASFIQRSLMKTAPMAGVVSLPIKAPTAEAFPYLQSPLFSSDFEELICTANQHLIWLLGVSLAERRALR